VKADLIRDVERYPPGHAPDGRVMDVDYAVLRYTFTLAPNPRRS
jgi:hypothetical protein